LPAWAKQIASEGYEIGYYVRNNGEWGDVADNATWFKSWLDKMSALGGNAQYVDVFARIYSGQNVAQHQFHIFHGPNSHTHV
jgi:hypothetical protein